MERHYEIRLADLAPAEVFSDRASRLRLVGDVRTVIRGCVRDDAAFHGLLRRLQGLHLEILAVSRLPLGLASAAPGGSRQEIHVEVVVAGPLGGLGRSFIGEVLRHETVEVRAVIGSVLGVAGVVDELTGAGADVRAIWPRAE